MLELDTLLTLSTFTLATFVAGYVGYWITSVGDIRAMLPIDRMFRLLAFALVFQGSFGVVMQAGGNTLLAYALACGIVLGLALLWRRWMGRWAGLITQRASGSMHDGRTSAWDTVLASDKVVTSCTVHLKSGRSLMCEQIAAFSDARIPRITLGEDGSVALYVTDIQDPDGTWSKADDVRHHWGDQLTIVPADQIAAVDLRIKA